MKKLGLAIALTLLCGGLSNAQEFLRGDANGDGRVNPLEDALCQLDYLFSGGDEPPCLEANDANNDGNVNIADTVKILNWGFGTTDTELPDPGTDACGEDDDEALGCVTEPAECPSEEPALDEDEDVVLSIGSATIDDDTVESVVITVSIDNQSADIRGFQFGVCYDEDIVCVADGSVEATADLEDLNPTFFLAESVDGAWGVGCLLDFVGFSAIEDGDDTDLLDVTYSIMGEGTTDLTFCDHPGTHEWPVRVFTVDGPALPTVEDGSITVDAFDGDGECVAPSGGSGGGGGGGSGGDDLDCIVDGGEGDYTFIVRDASGVVGGDVEVPVDLTVEGTCVIAWQFGMCFDTDDLSFDSGAIGEAIDPDAGVLFFTAYSEVEGNVVVGCIPDLLGTVALEEVDTYEILLATFTIEQDFGDTEVEICDLEQSFGTFPPGIVQQGGVLDDDASYDDGTVYTSSGFVSIIPSLAFERGDVDGSGDVMAILDAIHLLEYFFKDGAEPPCMDAGDVDDDGTIAGLLDSVYLLTYGYLNGDEPPAPFGDCDVDPTDDDGISCETLSSGCE